MERFPPPIRILAPGDVARRDFFDASHAPVFAQIEGLCVDEGISFVDIDPDTGKIALPGCPRVFREAFLAGTEPVQACDLHRF